ncbi:MAG: glycosyltransferase [Proteobacteria bacterium]|nr:glycosyltransferase [Pseudomonadota bacterium]
MFDVARVVSESYARKMVRRMSAAPAFSIVIPVYNVERYIGDCLKSLVRQGLQDVEIICVDDGSTDGTSLILSDYASRYENIKIIRHERNRSALQARKTGVMAATGHYILFVDGDDMLAPNGLVILHDLVQKSAADIIQFSVDVISEGPQHDRKAITDFIGDFEGRIAGDEILSACFDRREYSFTMWNKAYRSEVCKKAFRDIVDTYLNLAEDALSFFFIAFHAQSFISVKTDPVYLYRWGSGITSSGYDNLARFAHLCAQATVPDLIEKFLARRNASPADFAACRRLEDYLLQGCISVWLNELPEAAGARAFDLLIDAWGADRVLTVLAKQYDEYDLIGRRALGAGALTSQDRSVKRIGVHYIRIRNGGVERVISLLIPIWIHQGYEVVLITDEEPSLDDYAVPECTTRVVIPPTHNAGLNNRADRVAALRAAVAEHQIDALVHCSGSSPYLTLDLLSVKTLGIPVVVSLHETFCTTLVHRTREYLYRPNTLRLADCVTVLSRVDAAYYGILDVRTVFIPNPMDAELLEMSPAPLAGNIIVWVGRISPERQPSHALDIMAQVVRSVPDAKLLIVGKGELEQYKRELEAQVEQLGLADNVVFLGYFKNPRPIYQMASVFLSTSSMESYGMALLEGCLSGLPGVVYDHPQLELLRSGRGIIAVRQGDRTAAAKAITTLLRDPQLRRGLGRDARDVAKQLQNESNVPARWKCVFDELSDAEGQHSAKKVEQDDLRAMLSAIISYYGVGFTIQQSPSPPMGGPPVPVGVGQGSSPGQPSGGDLMIEPSKLREMHEILLRVNGTLRPLRAIWHRALPLRRVVARLRGRI